MVDPQQVPNGPRPASDHTRLNQERVASSLSLDDPDDGIRNARGLVRRPDSLVIPADRDPDRAAWDADRFDFIAGEAPDTVNPSLWRQECCNNARGLFQIHERIYQVRGYDISNVTFVAGDTGWVVIDPLTCTETSRAALQLLNDEVGHRDVRAVIYTHSHVDHFGGIRGVVSDEQVDSGEVPVIAPEGFLHAAVSENVIAGPAMLRRAAYMYGSLLPAGPRGLVGSGLGRTVPRGDTGLIAPTDSITHTGEERVLDGVRVEFQLAPDTEAPAEMHFFFPELRALCLAENCTCTMHNLYTPRGALVRDALAWSVAIHDTLRRFGGRADVSFASHHWPVWGIPEIDEYLRTQRDTYRFLHDQTMRLANRGFTGVEIAEMLDLPPSLGSRFNNRGYYGTVSHNVKAVYQRYLGWFDGNPANLNPLPPEEAGRRYVAFMGGADRLLAQARVSFDEGDYRWVAEVVNHLVFAEPDNVEARGLQADALEQLGYQAESGPWRNFYLTGAQELRAPEAAVAPMSRGAGAAMLAAMPVESVFDLLAVRLDGPAADGRTVVINWEFPDVGRSRVLGVEHGAVHHHEGADTEADASVRLDRSTLVGILAGELDVPAALAEGRISITGDPMALVWFLGLLDTDLPAFNIVTP